MEVVKKYRVMAVFEGGERTMLGFPQDEANARRLAQVCREIVARNGVELTAKEIVVEEVCTL